MIIHYLHNTDTYYFPHKELYIKRWMFLYSSPEYLAEMLGLDMLSVQERDSMFLILAQDQRVDYYDFKIPE